MKLDDYLAILDSFVGVTENPRGSNRTPIGREYGWDGVSWCAETISVACRRLGFPLHEAAVIRIENHARAGDWGMRWVGSPIRGAAVCFDWKGKGNWEDMHVGTVTSVLGDGRFRTIEGNYRDSCQRVLRDMKFVRGFAMFPFEDVPASYLPHQPQPQSTTPQEDSDRIMNLPVLKIHSTGFYVQMLQALMLVHARDLAKDASFIDGEFGPHTQEVLRTWQERTKVLEADGECGPATWRWITGTR